MLFLVAALILLPVLGTIWTSLHRDVTFLDREFIGLENYRELLSDEAFVQSLRFTLLFIAVTVPLELALGLGFALLLDRAIPGRGLWRACVLIPWAVPAAISARGWELIYNFHYGLANAALVGLGADEPVNFLGTEAGAFFAVVVADAWKTTPFVAIILLAGLQAVPRELYEQAKIDGASAGRAFLHVMLPMLKPVLITALLFRTIDAMRIFDLLYVLTGGGPGGATRSVSLYAYKFFNSGDFGFGSAASVVLFAAAFVLAVAYIRIGRFSKELA